MAQKYLTRREFMAIFGSFVAVSGLSIDDAMAQKGFRLRGNPATGTGDTTPDAFSFTTQSGVPLSVDRTSNDVVLSGLDAGTPISVTGGDYSINYLPWTNTPGTVGPDDYIKVRLRSSSSQTTATSCTLTVGTVSQTFSVTTASDTTPTLFWIPGKTGVALSTATTSDTITIAGLGSGVSVTASCDTGLLSKNGGSFTSSSFSVTNGDTIAARLTSASTNATPTSMQVTVGTWTCPFSVTTQDSTGRALIRPADIRYNGFYRIPLASTNDLRSSYLASCIRKVGTEKRILFTGAWAASTLYEITLPTSAPTKSSATAPRCTFVRDWGSFLGPFSVASSTGPGFVVEGGMLWIPEINGFIIVYGDAYVPQKNHPTLVAFELDDTAHTLTGHGPWHAKTGPQRFRDRLLDIPAAWATAHTSGQRYGVITGQHSGNVGSSFGPSLTAFSIPSLSTPADPADSTNDTIPLTELMFHSIDHPRTRDTRYKVCDIPTNPALGNAYQCELGASAAAAGAAIWGSQQPGSAETDSAGGASVWIDLPDKYGVVWFGKLCRLPNNATPLINDPDGLPHKGYGDPQHDSSSQGGNPAYLIPTQCCHWQQAGNGNWKATGPFSMYAQACGWIADPEEFVKVLAGTKQLYDVVLSTDLWELKEFDSAFDIGNTGMLIGQIMVDPDFQTTRKFYAWLNPEMNLDRTSYGSNQSPVIAEFEVL